MGVSSDEQAKHQRKIWTWIRNGSLKRETESLLIAAQNNAIRANYTRERNKLWNLRVKMIPIVFGGFGTVSKFLEMGLKELEVGGRTETIQITEFFRLVRVLKRAQETGEYFSTITLQWKAMARKTGVQSQVELYQKLKKNVLDASLLNTQLYKVSIEAKMVQSKKKCSAFSYTSVK